MARQALMPPTRESGGLDDAAGGHIAETREWIEARVGDGEMSCNGRHPDAAESEDGQRGCDNQRC